MPGGQSSTTAGELGQLGLALNERTADVVAAMMSPQSGMGGLLEDAVEERFARVGTVSTVAVARWMAGDGRGSRA